MKSLLDFTDPFAGEQVAADAGLHCLVYRQGAHGWKLDLTVQSYAPFLPGDPPPEPEHFEVRIASGVE